MRAPSAHWFEDIEQTRQSTWSSSVGPDFPVVPWIHPELHPQIRSLIERWGTEKQLGAQDPVLGTSDRVDQLVFVKSGITARCVGSPFSQSRLSVAVSIPGRLACGNLNFFTHRSCMGRYFALVPSVTLSVPQNLVMSLAKKDPEFMQILCIQFELANLSDRMGFAAETLLDIDDRILVFFLSWAVVYGHKITDGGTDWVEMPLTLRGEALRYVINCSSAAIERSLAALRKDGTLVVENDRMRVRLSALEKAHQWLRSSEEPSVMPRPEMLSRLFS